MQTVPSYEFLFSEKQRLENRLACIGKGEPPRPEEEGSIPFWKKDLAKYNKTMGVSDTQEKLKTVNFILE